MNKPILEAIEQGHPLHWEIVPGISFRLRLAATTWTWENGHTRTRTLWTTYDARLAHHRHGEILAADGKLTGPTPRQIFERWEENQVEVRK